MSRTDFPLAPQFRELGQELFQALPLRAVAQREFGKLNNLVKLIFSGASLRSIGRPLTFMPLGVLPGEITKTSAPSPASDCDHTATTRL
jgi:hypothetical protein